MVKQQAKDNKQEIKTPMKSRYTFKENYEHGEREFKRGRLAERQRVEKIIDKKIDHYEPYRPITDCSEAQEVRKVLAELKQEIAKEKNPNLKKALKGVINTIAKQNPDWQIDEINKFGKEKKT
jgi:hypothetical protein